MQNPRSQSPTVGEPLYALRLPRYTSYPPATEFGELDAGRHADWLSQLPPGRPVSLYIHIPYCQQLCWFCGCFTSITRKYERIRRYLGLLLQEIAVVRNLTGRLAVSHVHFGGGSPTILSAEDFTTLMDALRDHYRFQPDAEIAIEIDPRTVDPDKIAAYADTGVTRASLGVQDFRDEVQAAVNRIQPFSMVAETVNTLRSAGITRLNMDLMYGLPYQTVETVTETARQALSMTPNRVAIFGYAHVPWMRKHQRVLDDKPMASPEERPALFRAMRDVFLETGYAAVGIDHVARMDDSMAQALRERSLRRNFQGYTTDQAETVLGFGLSAISALPQGYAQNTTAAGDYESALYHAATPVNRGRAVNTDDRVRREIISELMCYFDVDLARICAWHNRPVDFQSERSRLQEFCDNGLLTVDNDVIRLTDKGRPYVRAVCAVFDQYYKDDGQRFSLAV